MNSLWLHGCFLVPLEGFIWSPSKSSCLYRLQKTVSIASARSSRICEEAKMLWQDPKACWSITYNLFFCCLNSACPAQKVCTRVNFPYDSWILLARERIIFPGFIWRYSRDSFLGKKNIMPQIHNSFLLWITNYFSCYIWNFCLQNLEAACSILLCSLQLQVVLIARKSSAAH